MVGRSQGLGHLLLLPSWAFQQGDISELQQPGLEATSVEYQHCRDESSVLCHETGPVVISVSLLVCAMLELNLLYFHLSEPVSSLGV